MKSGHWFRGLRDGTWNSGTTARDAFQQLSTLLEAILPPEAPPVPVVDWTKPIQRRDGRAAEYRGEVDCHDYTKLVLVRDPEDGQQYPDCYSPEGRFTIEELVPQDPRDIINVPSPEPAPVAELGYEVAVATTNPGGEKMLAIQFGECQEILISAKGEVYFINDCDCPGFNSEERPLVWQSRTVKG